MTAVYVEVAAKRAIASAIDWPGLFRGGRDEEEALASLLAAGPRYASVMRGAGLEFEPPTDKAGLEIVERVAGDSGTDYGVPSIVLPSDAVPLDAAELERSIGILRACWAAFDRAARLAEGKELRKGPRGGGRDLEGILRHVLEAESGYASRIGLKYKWGDIAGLPDILEAMATSRERVIAGLREIAVVGLPPPGPRGGARWPARYFVRRVAYHVVDHTWEMEDRVEPVA